MKTYSNAELKEFLQKYSKMPFERLDFRSRDRDYCLYLHRISQQEIGTPVTKKLIAEAMHISTDTIWRNRKKFESKRELFKQGGNA